MLSCKAECPLEKGIICSFNTACDTCRDQSLVLYLRVDPFSRGSGSVDIHVVDGPRPIHPALLLAQEGDAAGIL